VTVQRTHHRAQVQGSTETQCAAQAQHMT